MAQFRGTLEGNRGPASRLGTKQSGLNGTVNAWNVGANICARHDQNGDSIEFLLTCGSDRHNPRILPINVFADDRGAFVVMVDGKVIAEKKAEQ